MLTQLVHITDGEAAIDVAFNFVHRWNHHLVQLPEAKYDIISFAKYFHINSSFHTEQAAEDALTSP